MAEGATTGLASAQKSARGVSLYSRHVNRPLGRVLAAGALRLRMTAQQVTYMSALVTLVGLAALCLAEPRPVTGAVGAVLLVLGFALDSADGQVARATATGSPAGEWTDHLVDAGKMVAVHGAVLVAFVRWGLAPGQRWLLVPVAFQLVATLTFAGGTLADLVTRAATSGAAATPSPTVRPSRARAIALLPADYGVLCWVFLTWGWPTLFRTLYGALLALDTIILVTLVRRWYQRLRALQPDGGVV